MAMSNQEIDEFGAVYARLLDKTQFTPAMEATGDPRPSSVVRDPGLAAIAARLDDIGASLAQAKDQLRALDTERQQ